MQNTQSKTEAPKPSDSPRATSPADLLDAGLVLILFLLVSLYAGRAFRYPFDDEIHTLRLIERLDLIALFRYLTGGNDIHPPLSFLVFKLLWMLGLDAEGLRLFSLTFTGLSLALARGFMLPRTIDGAERAVSDRLVLLVLFATAPLCVSQGDALRWYPIFGLLAALAMVASLRGRTLLCWTACGLMVSTNLLGLPVAVLLLLGRHLSGTNRKKFLSEFKGLPLFILLAAPGVLTLLSGFGVRSTYGGSQLSSGVVKAAVQVFVGFFGGHSLGLRQSILLLPLAALCLFALIAGLKHPSKRALALQFLLPPALVLMGFYKPRSFLYLQPLLMVLIGSLYLSSSAVVDNSLARRPLKQILIGTVALFSALLCLPNLRWNDTPFKRNSVVLYSEVERFVALNSAPGDIVLTTDPVLFHVLSRVSGLCVRTPELAAQCPQDQARRILFVTDQGRSESGTPKAPPRARELLSGLTLTSRASFGLDREARLKRRLTPGLSDFILSAEVYARPRPNGRPNY